MPLIETAPVPGSQMTPVVVEIYYAVIMVDTTLIARNRAMASPTAAFKKNCTRRRNELIAKGAMNTGE